MADQGGELSMAGRAVLTITPPAGSADGQSLAPTALNLGWRLAELYGAPGLRGADIPPPGGHLPSLSELGSGIRYVILFSQVESALKSLRGVLRFPAPDENLSQIRELIRVQASRDEVSSELLGLHVRITDALAANAARLATAYGLGRALFDTCHPPDGDGGGQLTMAFNHYRLEVLHDWLGQLEDLFPERTARAVARSLHMWEAWAQHAGPAENADGHVRVLTRQGELWRRVLTAEQDPLRLLGPQDYVNAGIGFLVRIRRMVTQFAVQWAAIIVVALVALGAAIWAAVTYASTDTGKLAAILASLAGTLGLSWKGVGGTLGKGLGVVQKPLWDAEVDTALALAITRLPGRAGAPRRSARGRTADLTR